MSKTPLHLTRGQTEVLTATQRLKMRFNNSEWYYALNGNDLIFTDAYKVMGKIW